MSSRNSNKEPRGTQRRVADHSDMRAIRSNPSQELTWRDADRIYLALVSRGKKVMCGACGTEYRESWIFEGECWPSCDRTAEMRNLIEGAVPNMYRVQKALNEEIGTT